MVETRETSIVTFYSYKGGVGRTLALLNSAYALAQAGRTVLMLDLDLEAPGLSTFLTRQEEISTAAPFDAIDFLEWGIRALAETPPGQDSEIPASRLPSILDYVSFVAPEKLDGSGTNVSRGCVAAIVCDESRDYIKRLENLELGRLNRADLRRLGRLLSLCLRRPVLSVAAPDYYPPDQQDNTAFDYVLVDSRTGLNETGGLCVGPLSDALAVVLGLNDQNIEGTRRFLEIIGVDTSSKALGNEQRTEKRQVLGPKPTLLVASPVPTGDAELKKSRLDMIRRQIGSVGAQLTYHPRQALIESILVRDFPEEHLAAEYLSLTETLMELVGDAPEQLLQDASLAWFDKRDGAVAIALILRAVGSIPLVAVEFMLKQISNDFIPSDDVGFIAHDRLYRALMGLGSEEAITLRKWSAVLAHWGTCTEDSNLRALRFKESLAKNNEALVVVGSDRVERDRLVVNRANVLEYLGRDEEAAAVTETLLAEDGLSRAAMLSVLMAHARIVNTLGRFGEAIDSYQRAIDIIESASDEERKEWSDSRLWRSQGTGEYQTTSEVSATVRLGLARTYSAMSSWAQARVQLQTVLGEESLPRAARMEAQIGLAHVEAGAGRPRESAKALLAVAKAGANTDSVIKHALMISYRSISEEQAPVAAEILRRMTARWPDLAFLKTHLGIALLASGEEAQAKSLFDRLARGALTMAQIDGILTDLERYGSYIANEELVMGIKERLQARRESLSDESLE